MIAKYNRISFYWGVPGILLPIAGIFVLICLPEPDYIALPIFIIFMITGRILLLVGLAYYAKAKERRWTWCFIALLGLVGLIVLLSLDDRSQSALPEKTYPSVASNTSVLAVVSLVLGGISLFAFGLPGIPGLILGSRALRAIKRNPETVSGKLLAIIGIILSAIGIALVILILLSFGYVAVKHGSYGVALVLLFLSLGVLGLIIFFCFRDKEKTVSVIIKQDRCKLCDREINESEMAYVVDGGILCFECEKKLPISEL
jgi:MFS family permease